MRFLVIALGLMAATIAPATALEPQDLLGRWSTEWANAAGEEPNGSADVYIMQDADASGSLDGVWDTPGVNGVMHGTIERGEDGELVWTGRWAPPNATSDAQGGTFRFVFTNARAFAGIWSADNGGVQDAPWNGRRR
jgi:hypothetical protein